MKISPKNIIETYSYTESEQETFLHIREYMKLIKPKLHEIENDNEKLKRFALIGLFLAYRSCNHIGNELTTEEIFIDYDNLHVTRIKTVKEFFNISIISSSDYLNMINFTFLDFILMSFRLKNISKKMYKFVVN